MSLYCHGVNSYLYVNKREIYKFKAYDHKSWYEFFLGSTLENFTKNEQNKILSSGMPMIFCLIKVQFKKKIYLIFILTVT